MTRRLNRARSSPKKNSSVVESRQEEEEEEEESCYNLKDIVSQRRKSSNLTDSEVVTSLASTLEARGPKGIFNSAKKANRLRSGLSKEGRFKEPMQKA